MLYGDFMMLKICTVYFDGIYTPEYVSKLYRSLKRNSTIPFQFICLTDNDNIEADIVLPYNHHSEIKKHWHKLKFFSPQFAYQEPGDDVIIMDIDQIIVNNVDDLLNWKVNDNELLTYGQWWNNKLKINGGFYKFKSGSLKYVWDDFSLNPEYWQLHYYNIGDVHYKYYGEQNYVSWKILQHHAKLTKTPEQWIFKYSSDIEENINLHKLYRDKFRPAPENMVGDGDYTSDFLLGANNEEVKVVHFTGPGKTIHEHEVKFIKDNWV